MSLEAADGHEEEDPDDGSVCHWIHVSENPASFSLEHGYSSHLGRTLELSLTFTRFQRLCDVHPAHLLQLSSFQII